jgi:outer membrane receptor protein involved in Fe transport
MNYLARLLALPALAFFVFSLAFGTAAFADSPNALRIGYTKTGPLLLLKEQGRLEKRLAAQGVAAQWVEVKSEPALIDALNGGAIDFGYTGDAAPIFAQAAGLNFVYVASLPQAERDSNTPVPAGAKGIAPSSGFFLASRDYAGAHADAIKAVIDEAASALRGSYEVAGLTPSVLRRQQALADAYAKSGTLAHPVDINAVVFATPDVIVVAQRRPQQSQKVGISIATVPSKVLTENGVRTVNGLEKYVSNLQITPQFGTGQPSFAIRGVGTDFNDYGSNNAPVVGFYINDVAYPIPATTQGQLYDIQRVEVLRGPQGTLYGRNTTGGAINVITNKPAGHLAYGGSVEYGGFGGATHAEGFFSAPLSKTTRFRLAGATNQGGGWQFNRVTGQSLGNSNTKALRGILDWDPTSNLSYELNLHWDRDQSDGVGSSLLAARAFPDGTIAPPDTSVRATGWGASPGFAQEIGISPDSKPFRDNKGFGIDLQTVVTLPFAKLTSLTSAERFDRREYDALDGTSGGFADVYFATRAAAYAEELRLTSLGGSPVSWQTGVYYSREHLNEEYDSGFANLVSVTPEIGFALHAPYLQDVATTSIYGHLERDLGSKLKLVLGARLENEQRKISDFSVIANLTGASSGVAFASGPASDATRYTLPSEKAELDYQVRPDSLLYASVSAGVKSGGFTTYNTTNAGLAIRPYLPERLRAYEIGSKNEFNRHRVRLNGDLYYYDYRDQQILGITVSPDYGAVGSFVNAPKSHLYGGELEFDWLPGNGLRIAQNLGLTAGAFDEFIDTIGATSTKPYQPIVKDLAGKRIGAPRWTYTLDASDTFKVNSQFSGEFGGSFSYRDRYVSLLDTPTNSYDIKPYSLVNLYATLIPNAQNWRLTAFGRNIFSEKYLLSNNYFDNGANAIGIQGEPATFGLRLSYKFN